VPLLPVADGVFDAATVELEAVPFETGVVGLVPGAHEALVGRVIW
jgi:hypothetical protein